MIYKNPSKFVIILNTCMHINYLVVNLMKTAKLWLPSYSVFLNPLIVSGKENAQTRGGKFKIGGLERLEPVTPISLVRYVNHSAITARRRYSELKRLAITFVRLSSTKTLNFRHSSLPSMINSLKWTTKWQKSWLGLLTFDFILA